MRSAQKPVVLFWANEDTYKLMKTLVEMDVEVCVIGEVATLLSNVNQPTNHKTRMRVKSCGEMLLANSTGKLNKSHLLQATPKC